MQALQAGKHVLVEKPMTTTSAEAVALIEEAERRGLVLMVDHTFVYTGAVRKIRELIASGELGEIYYYDSMRVNLGLVPARCECDLGSGRARSRRSWITCSPSIRRRSRRPASATSPAQPENIAYLTMFFEENLIAHINVNWLSPVKVRRTLIGGSKQMIVYDDMEPSEKVKVYDKGITLNERTPRSVYKMLVGYRTGDMCAPQLEVTEALRVGSAALRAIASRAARRR